MTAKPFIKWAGGKRSLVPTILELNAAPDFDPEVNHYYEPFVGGGAVFFGLQSILPSLHATLSDANQELITTYRMVKGHSLALGAHLEQLAEEHAADPVRTYAKMRALQPVSELTTAARFIYLNKTCFNGLYRVNKKGEFNVPIGRGKSPPKILDMRTIYDASRAMQNATIKAQDFEAATSTAKPGDLVYFDPPYIPLHDPRHSIKKNFTAYTKAGFSYKDHVRLRDCALDLKNKGVHVIISNSDTKATRDLYTNLHHSLSTSLSFTLHPVTARRSINSDGANRGHVGELIIT